MRFHPSVELALGANLVGQPNTWSWTDYTDLTFDAGKLVITRGRSDRYSSAPPAKCTLTVDNTGGLFVPTNPESALYGLIGINTPLRVLMRAETNSVTDSFTRSVSNGWGTSSSGAVWTSTGTAANFSVSSTFGRHTHASANVPLYDTLPLTMLRSDITVKVRVNALSTGAPQTVACVSRWVDASNSNRCELRFNTDQTISLRLVHRAAGVDTATTSVTTTLTHTAANWYWLRVQVGKSTVRAKVWADGSTQPRDWQLDGSNGVELANPTANQPGLYSVRETGNTNASATLDFDEFTLVDGAIPQFTGFVDEWPTRWFDQSARQSFVPVSASGQLRRIQQEPTLRSALFRAHTADYRSANPTVKGYWPMEDGRDSRTFASAVGGPPMIYSNYSPASSSVFKGSDALPAAGTGGGSWYGVVRKYTSPSPNAWSVRMVSMFPNGPSANTIVAQWNTSGGSMWRWQFILGVAAPDVFKLQAFDSAGTEKLGAAGVNFTDVTGTELYGSHPLYLRADATQNGANIDWTYYLTFVDTNGSPTTKTGSGSTAGSLGNVSKMFSPTLTAFAAGTYVFGHVGVGTDIGWGPGNSDAITGYAGETTGARFQRLCDEQNFAFLFGDLVTGSTTSVQLMGEQNGTSMQSQLQQVEATEEGVLFDSKQGHVQLLPRSLRRNHTVDLALDMAQHHVNWPFEPTFDRFLLKNDVTVSNPGGTSSRVVGTGDAAPAVIGTYQDSVSVNTYLESDLDNHANFRLAMGIANVSEGRLPQLVLNFARTPALADSWLNADVGSRVTVANMPSVLDPTPLDLIVDGYTETIDQTVWTAALNCSPSTVWNSFTLQATGNQGRLDSYSSYLMAGYTSSATTMRIGRGPHLYGKSSAPLWSTTAEPYDLNVAGERLTVTAMTQPTSAFVAAGTAAHGNNASVVPALPAGIQNGDLLLILAAIRNTAATVNGASNPGGWTVLADGGNVVLYGQIWDGSFAAPTVAFAGGAAGDTTSAQMAAFRYTQNVVVSTSGVQSNALAANIAVPSIAIPRDRSMVITCGWKQSNWTSVATLAFNTEIGEPSSALGSTQGIVWDYSYVANSTTAGATNFVVTGGVNAVSKAFAVALATDVCEATVTRSVNGVTKAQGFESVVQLWRPGRVAL